MRLRNVLIHFTVGAVGLVVLNAAACLESRHSCAGGCRGSPNVVLDLTCGGTDLTREVLTGPCNLFDSSTPNFGGSDQQYVYIPSYEPGDCHVELDFASGFTFRTDVHFTKQTDQSDPQCPCDYIQPDRQTIPVNNPSSTCVDAGPPVYPYILEKGLNGPIGLAVDSTNAYWTEESGGFVLQAAIWGGIPIQRATQASPSGLAIDSQNIYWTDFTSSGAVMKISIGYGMPVTLAAGQSYPASIAVDNAIAYWTNSANGAVALGSVVKVSLSDGGAPATLASGQNIPNGIAVDGTSVYWANSGSTPTNGAILSVPLGGGTVTTLAAGQGGPQGIAVDGTSVYWTNFGTPGSVVKVPIGGGTPTTLASGQRAPAWLSVDGANVYWTNYGTGASDGEVVKVAVGGGTPVTLLTGQNGPTGIAVDATSVYWLTGTPGMTNGNLLKLTPK